MLCLTRIGILIVIKHGAVAVDARISFLKIRVFPGKEQKQKEKRKKATPAGDTEKAEKPKKEFPPISAGMVRDAITTLWPPLKKALRRTWRGIRIAPLNLSVILGGAEDPAATAELYGYIQAGIWTMMPFLEKLMDIRSPRIHTDIDFNASTVVVDGKIGISARIGTLMAVGMGILIPAVRWFLRFRKQVKRQAPAKKPEAAA